MFVKDCFVDKSSFSVSSRPFSKLTEIRSFLKKEASNFGQGILCVQEVVTPIYIITHYINWGNYFLDTRYIGARENDKEDILGNIHRDIPL